MAVATDATLKILANSVGGIDTSGLMKDTTGQSIVNAINNLALSIPQPIIYNQILTDSVVIPENTYTTVDSITLPEGKYNITFRYSFPANNTGRRQMIVTNSATGTSSYNSMYDSKNTVIGATTSLLIVNNLNVDSNGITLYIRMLQNSGSNLTVTSGIITYLKY